MIYQRPPTLGQSESAVVLAEGTPARRWILIRSGIASSESG